MYYNIVLRIYNSDIVYNIYIPVILHNVKAINDIKHVCLYSTVYTVYIIYKMNAFKAQNKISRNLSNT